MYNVLLVEDEEIIRKGIILSVPWEEFNCHVIGEAENGEEGKALIEKLKPDIVITDIDMPIKDGLSMLAETKFDYDYAAIILTGYSDFEYAREAIRIGISSYVLKPLNMKEMKEALEQAILESQNIYRLREINQKSTELKNIHLIDNEKQCSDALVNNILTYIANNYKKKISLSDLAEYFHYSERYISQKFQRALNTTIIEYLNRYRMQKALELLKEGTVPLSEIGWECGIGEYKYFNFVFKKYIGCSIKTYLKNIKM